MFKAVILIIISVFLGVVGQVNLKQGMIIVTKTQKEKNLLPQNTSEIKEVKISTKLKSTFFLLLNAFLNPRIIGGLFCYFISMLLWLIVLSKVDLSVAYPLLGTSYILIVFSAWFILKEPVSLTRWIGTCIISIGVILVARS
jgi:multidrug transporter EmrE-like cation transporter